MNTVAPSIRLRLASASSRAAAGAVTAGALLRPGPLRQVRAPSPAYDAAATAPAGPAPKQAR